MAGVPPWPKLAARRGSPASSITPLARIALRRAAMMSNASSHEIGTKPGSSLLPFFGLVRFIGVRMRFGVVGLLHEAVGLDAGAAARRMHVLGVEIRLDLGGDAVLDLDLHEVGTGDAIVAEGRKTLHVAWARSSRSSAVARSPGSHGDRRAPLEHARRPLRSGI